MRLIYEPKVQLLVQPLINMEGWNNFKKDEGIENIELDWRALHASLIPEVAGRLCYMSFQNPRPGGNKAYLDRIKESGHGSVLEHANWSFIFTGISRSLSHELVRHRAGWGFSQLSQRYVDSKDVAFIVPVELQDEVRAAMPLWEEHGNLGYVDPTDKPPNVVTGLDWLTTTQNCLDQYAELANYLSKKIERQMIEENTSRPDHQERVKAGILSDTFTTEQKTEMRKRARQTARSVLPNAAETKMFVTGNARAFRHFIEQRGSKHAESEIRRLAYEVWLILVKEAPNVFGDYEWLFSGPESTGGRPMDVNTRTRKV